MREKKQFQNFKPINKIFSDDNAIHFLITLTYEGRDPVLGL